MSVFSFSQWCRVGIEPVWVLALDEAQFPCAIPFLHLLFAQDGGLDVVGDFIIHQMVEVVFLGETFHAFLLVLMNTLYQVAGEADLQGAVALIGEDVDIALFHIYCVTSLLFVIPAQAGIHRVVIKL